MWQPGAEKREEIKRSLPVNHKITYVTKKTGEMWKSILADQSQSFEETYSAQKANLPVAPRTRWVTCSGTKLFLRSFVFFTNASSIMLMWCRRCWLRNWFPRSIQVVARTPRRLMRRSRMWRPRRRHPHLRSKTNVLCENTADGIDSGLQEWSSHHAKGAFMHQDAWRRTQMLNFAEERIRSSRKGQLMTNQAENPVTGTVAVTRQHERLRCAGGTWRPGQTRQRSIHSAEVGIPHSAEAARQGGFHGRPQRSDRWIQRRGDNARVHETKRNSQQNTWREVACGSDTGLRQQTALL